MDEEKMRSTVRDLLSKGEVKYVIGYEKAGFGQKVRPCIITSAEEADKLVLSPMCKNNLAVYLTLEPPEEKGKIALIAKGCDARALIQLVQERGVERDDLVILGVPCPGMIDPDKLYEEVLEEDIVGISESDDAFVISTKGGERTFKKADVIFDECGHCAHPTPLIADIMLGEVIEGGALKLADPTKDMSPDERWAYWSDKFETCIRCYACRQACPLCFCEECAADSLRPNWVRRSVNRSENTAWHIMRAFHHAGRCSECGECERVCPVGLPLMALNKMLAQEAKEVFDFTAGIDTEGKPLLTSFETNDKEDFIL